MSRSRPPSGLTLKTRLVVDLRQALDWRMLWSKQFFFFDVANRWTSTIPTRHSGYRNAVRN